MAAPLNTSRWARTINVSSAGEPVHMVHLACCLYVMTLSRAMPKYHSPKDYLDAARSSETSPTELRVLAQSVYDFVVTAVAWNPNTEADVLTKLVPQHIESWDEQDRARAIAQHPHTPEETLGLLAERLLPILNKGRGHTLGLQAGVALCENPKTPWSAILAIFQDHRVSTDFRKLVVRETQRDDLLELLLNDRSEVIRRRARQRIEGNAI
jgi:hypothetical protein